MPKNYRPDAAARSNQSAPKTVAFAQKPHGFAADKRLDLNDRGAIDALLFYAQFASDGSRAWCTMSDQAVSDYMGVSLATGKRSLAKLKACGYTSHEKRSLGKNKTGRVVHLVWVVNPEILPAPPEACYEARVAAQQLGLRVAPETRPDPPSASSPVSEPSGGTSLTRDASPRSPVRELASSSVSDKEESRIQEFQECLSSSSWGTDGGRMEGGGTEASSTQADPAAIAKAWETVGEAVELPDLTRRAIEELLVEVGPKYVEESAKNLRQRLDAKQKIPNPVGYLLSTARKMHKQGGYHGQAIPTLSKHEQQRRKWDRELQAEQERRRRLYGEPDVGQDIQSKPISKAEAVRRQRQIDLAQAQARRRERSSDGD